MTDRPIIFNDHSVREILAGRKTQTRRLVKLREFQRSGYDLTFRDARLLWNDFTSETLVESRFCPFHVGDRLWVKESWKSREYFCSEEPQDDDHECGPHCHQVYVYYRATPRVGFRPTPDSARITYLDNSSTLTDWYTTGFKSVMYMPRWASRLTLVVSSVRVERLHEISDADVVAEGIALPGMIMPGHFTSIFAKAWDEINGKRATWSSNPWVWRVEFNAEVKPNA